MEGREKNNTEPQGKSKERAPMSDDRIEALRERLYARGDGAEESGKAQSAGPYVHHTVHPLYTPSPQVRVPLPEPTPDMTKNAKSFRLTAVLIALAFCIGALGVSSYFFFSGSNKVSGNNIGVIVDGPLTVGGGDALNYKVSVRNENTLPIEAATLIVEYPRGAESATDSGKALFTERQQLNNINPSEAVDVPMKVFMFGEENEEKVITVSVEYRIRGSNATFFKKADPYRFKISSSPLVLRVDGVKSISSGQEMDLTIDVLSNAPTSLKNVVVKASYPSGFDFMKSDPDPVSGEDTWSIPSLEPGTKTTIAVHGIMVGKEGATERFSVSTGIASDRDIFSFTSPLTTASADLSIEKPFLGVEVAVNGETDAIAVIDRNESAQVTVRFKNALETAIYDGVIKVELMGNALSEIDVEPDAGHYDSSEDTIRWDSVDVPELKELAPGDAHMVQFTLDPKRDIGETPEIKFKVTVEGKRVLEDRVPESVVGFVERTIRIQSIASLTSSALYSDGPFTNSGPQPPVAEKTTEYTYLLRVKNGTNGITGGEVTAVIPQYVTWLNNVSDGDTITYNATTRTMKWTIGSLEPNGYAEVWAQVALKASLSQVGSAPTILETQRFKATDKFTGTALRASAPAFTTNLENDPDRDARDGRVRKEN